MNNYEITPIDAYELFYEAYMRDDDILKDYYFESFVDGVIEFKITISYTQKKIIGYYLLEEHKKELEEYRDYLIKSDHESLEEDIVMESKK